MKKYIKVGLWVFFLSLLYGSGLLKAELMYIFSGVYSYYFKNIYGSMSVGLVCGILTAGLCSRGVVFCVIASVCFTAVCFIIPLKNRKKLIFAAILFICMLIYESVFYLIFFIRDIDIISAFGKVILPSVIYNTFAGAIICFLFEKSFAKKEHYVFIKR